MKKGLVFTALAIVAGGAIYAGTRKKDDESNGTDAPGRTAGGGKALITPELQKKIDAITEYQKGTPAILTSQADLLSAFNRMSEAEINDLHDFVFTYLDKDGHTVKNKFDDKDYEARMIALVAKYKIFQRYFDKNNPTTDKMEIDTMRTATKVELPVHPVSGTTFKNAAVQNPKTSEQVSDLYGWLADVTYMDAKEKAVYDAAFNKMSVAELADTHSMVFNYILKSVKPTDKNFIKRIAAIISKYKILTGKKTVTTTMNERKLKLLNWAKGSGSQKDYTMMAAVIKKMSDQEINDMFTAVFGYIIPKKQITDPRLKKSIAAISKKYNVFN